MDKNNYRQGRNKKEMCRGCVNYTRKNMHTN